MSRATTAAAAADIEETIVPIPADLRQDPEARRTRAYLQRELDRARALPPAEQSPGAIEALKGLAALLESDPTLAIRTEGARWMELAVELARQMGSVERQAALANDHHRLQDEHAQLRTRLHDVLGRVRALARPDWDTPHGRRRLALERMPDPDFAAQVLAEAADRLRSAVGGALAVNPDLPEARPLLDLAEQVQTLATTLQTRDEEQR